MRVVLLGPPGCGKGTQAVRLSQSLGVPAISTGDILREGVRKGSELGEKAKGYMDRGELVPDDIMLDLVARRLEEEDTKEGFILDGFPRTLSQARGLSSFLKERGMDLRCVLYIDVALQTLAGRLSARRVCSNCGAVYNVITSPPQKSGACGECGSVLVRRVDDEEETVRERLKIFEKQTAPLRDYYEREGVLCTVDGNGGVEEVFAKIGEVLV